MIGGMRIMPWRQCNTVAPAVTATQTGAGTHNGIALTVEVLTGANITISGPQYQSSYNPGAAASNNAASPAGVTITPQATGSRIYGAVNRNDAAASWTPDANTMFYQNIADATNGATYGTFKLSSSSGATPTAPIQTNYTPGGSPGTSITSLEVDFPSPTTAGNTIVVCYTGSVASGFMPDISGITLGGSPGNFAFVTSAAWYFWTEIWYDPNCAGGQTQVVIDFAANTGGGSGPLTYAQIYEVPGTLLLDQQTSNIGPSTGTTTWTSGATSMTTEPNEIWFGCAATAAVTQAVTGLGTWVTNNISGAHWASLFGYQIVSAEAAASYHGTQSSQNYPQAAIATFYLSTGGSDLTTAGVPVTVGASNGPGSGANGGVAACEILAGGVLADDPSSPAPVSSTSATSVTTAHFTPPMGSLLVAMVAADGGTGVQLTDDNGELTWVEQARWASGTSGYAGVWTAVVVCG